MWCTVRSKKGFLQLDHSSAPVLTYSHEHWMHFRPDAPREGDLMLVLVVMSYQNSIDSDAPVCKYVIHIAVLVGGSNVPEGDPCQRLNGTAAPC